MTCNYINGMIQVEGEPDRKVLNWRVCIIEFSLIPHYEMFWSWEAKADVDSVVLCVLKLQACVVSVCVFCAY